MSTSQNLSKSELLFLSKLYVCKEGQMINLA